MRDTSAPAQALVDAAVLRRDPAARLRECLSHSEAMRELGLSRLRARHPGLSTLALVEILLGTQLVPDPPRRP